MLADPVAQVDMDAYSARRLTGDLAKLLDEAVRR
jgi:hypothetical protein